MKKTYATSMPDHIGAFLKASRCFAALTVHRTVIHSRNCASLTPMLRTGEPLVQM